MSALKDISKEDVECVAVAIWHGDTVEGLGWGGPESWESQETRRKDRFRRIAVRVLKALAATPTPMTGWKNEHCNGEPEADKTGATLVSGALADIAAERHRQVEAEGWSPSHDDEHAHDEIARAAACYALPQGRRWAITEGLWPWDRAWWKPGDRRRDLVKAGALIVSEIERLDRATPATTAETPGPAEGGR